MSTALHRIPVLDRTEGSYEIQGPKVESLNSYAFGPTWHSRAVGEGHWGSSGTKGVGHWDLGGIKDGKEVQGPKVQSLNSDALGPTGYLQAEGESHWHQGVHKEGECHCHSYSKNGGVGGYEVKGPNVQSLDPITLRPTWALNTRIMSQRNLGGRNEMSHCDLGGNEGGVGHEVPGPKVQSLDDITLGPRVHY